MLRKLIVLGVVGLLPALAFAQPQAGDWELTLNGSGTGNKDLSAANIGAGIGVGYFFTKSAEVGVRQNISYSDIDHDNQGDRTGGGTAWNGETRAFFDWHFDLDRFQPFVGVNGGYAYGDTTRDTWIAGLEGGLKYYIHRNAFLFGTVEYQFDLRGEFGDGNFVYNLGIGVNF
jgi:hypothetical protein